MENPYDNSKWQHRMTTRPSAKDLAIGHAGPAQAVPGDEGADAAVDAVAVEHEEDVGVRLGACTPPRFLTARSHRPAGAGGREEGGGGHRSPRPW